MDVFAECPMSVSVFQHNNLVDLLMVAEHRPISSVEHVIVAVAQTCPLLLSCDVFIFSVLECACACEDDVKLEV